MRATEFISENKDYYVDDYHGVGIKLTVGKWDVKVKALDHWGNEIAHVDFGKMDSNELEAQDLWVNDDYRGQGTAAIMYDFVKSKGYKINKSPDVTQISDQGTQSGEHFWKKNRGEETVWESVDAEFIIENIAGRNKSKIYNLLLSQIGSGPFDGGCVVMAQAIQAVYGGDIVVLVGHAQHGTNEVAQHAAVKIGNILVDFGGAYEPHEFVRHFERNELAHAGGKITGIRPIQDGDLPDAPRDPAVSEIIARLLK